MSLLASDPNQPRRRRNPLPPCRYCEASGMACDSLHWLRGRTCCEACAGDHETTEERQP